MKTLEQQTKEAAWILLGIGAICVALSLTGCGREIVRGPQGAQGIQGVTGAQGAPGENCTVTTLSACHAAPNGGSLIACPDGTQSLVLNGATGAQGAQGATGATGQQGATGSQGNAGQNGSNGHDGTNGHNGTNGTIVTAMQFCPGITPHYPSAFPEVGFCIAGTLYAVYSANDGFLAEITPGTYSSDGIHASCTFTVESNCEVNR